MAKRKVKVLIPWSPKGFNFTALNDKGQRENRFVICKRGDVIELDEEKAEKAIKNGIVAPAGQHDRVTKVAEYGAYRNAESGTKEPDSVLTETDAND